MHITLQDRYLGAMLGLAAGDALGTTLEFKPPGSFVPLADMMGGGPFNLKPGQWTDDTSMALCLAESLIEAGFDRRDQLERYVRWWRDGHFSSTGTCFDIGNTTRAALARFERTAHPDSGSRVPGEAGNGSLMRLAPVPLRFANDPALAMERAGESSSTTHAMPTAVDACRYYAGLIVGAVKGMPKAVLLGERFSPADGYWDAHPLCPEIDEIASGSFARRAPPEIRGTGFVVNSLEAALWAFNHATNFEHGALLAVNLGDDADTTGAIYGQLAGAFFGVGDIPAKWCTMLAMRPTLDSLALKLLELSGAGSKTDE